MTPVTPVVVVGTVVALMGKGVAVVVNTNASSTLTQHHGASRPKVGKRINRKVREFSCAEIIWRGGLKVNLSLF